MITNGESHIDKVVAVTPDGNVGSPCGACREYMLPLDKNSGYIEILLDLETEKTIKLKELYLIGGDTISLVNKSNMPNEKLKSI